MVGPLVPCGSRFCRFSGLRASVGLGLGFRVGTLSCLPERSCRSWLSSGVAVTVRIAGAYPNTANKDYKGRL